MGSLLVYSFAQFKHSYVYMYVGLNLSSSDGIKRNDYYWEVLKGCHSEPYK